MNRDNIRLLARARHDADARLEVGRRYLQGLEGFPRNELLGVEYLSHPHLDQSISAARVVCEALGLDRLVAFDRLGMLSRLAATGHADAQFKLGVWLGAGLGQRKEAMRWLASAARSQHEGAARVVAVVAVLDDARWIRGFADAVSQCSNIPLRRVLDLAARRARDASDMPTLLHCCVLALAQRGPITADLARQVLHVLRHAPSLTTDGTISSTDLEGCLEALVAEGDHDASFLLGCALCGLPNPEFSTGTSAIGRSMRKGVALLLRSADSGHHAAWMHLYKLHADNRGSLANPQLARFFLEKAAAHGDPVAQRVIGALTMRTASTLKESEAAIAWLHAAANQDDRLAMRLLESLVLPLAGSDQEADRAIAAVRDADPWLAMRMRLARDFGLTRQEALCIDPVAARRPWGLSVGQNPFIALPVKAAPRAVPAITTRAAETVVRAALLFEAGMRDGNVAEGDWRRRSSYQRALFARLDIDQSLVFATAGSTALNVLRKGHKWALRVKPDLRQALAA